MSHEDSPRHWFWATLVLSSISIVAVVFAFWELVENNFFTDLNYVSLHYLYISRGIVSSLLLAFWAAWFVMRQRRANEDELRQSRERYRGLLDVSPGAVVLYDGLLRVMEWNSTAERLYGYTREELVGGTLPTIPPEREVELANYLRRVQAEEPVLDDETVRMAKRGEHIAVRLSLLPYHEGAERYFLEVTADIREQVQLRQKLIEVEKLTSMGLMAAGTAHHMNTPLASMLLRVQMLAERTKDSELLENLSQLEASIGSCQQFVRRLLDFSRRPSAQKQPERVKGAVEAVLGFIGPSLAAKRVNLRFEIGPGADQYVMCDRNQLETVLLTLLSNALDAVRAEGNIRVKCERASMDSLLVSVEDNGCGIEAEHLERVFDPFVTTKAPGRGTGLGLSIARNIVQEHGGTIKLTSEVGRGTCAMVELPVFSGVLSCATQGAR